MDFPQFRKGTPLCDALEKLGYVPPNSCGININIDMKGMEIPTVTIKCYASPELAEFIEHLRGSAVHLEVIGDALVAQASVYHDAMRRAVSVLQDGQYHGDDDRRMAALEILRSAIAPAASEQSL